MADITVYTQHLNTNFVKRYPEEKWRCGILTKDGKEEWRCDILTKDGKNYHGVAATPDEAARKAVTQWILSNLK